MYIWKAFLSVLGYIGYALMLPVRGWQWCTHYERPYWIMFLSMLGTIIIPLVICVYALDSCDRQQKQSFGQKIKKEEDLKRIKDMEIITACHSKGGMYVFVYEGKPTGSEWMCITGRPIELNVDE